MEKPPPKGFLEAFEGQAGNGRVFARRFANTAEIARHARRE
jgi:hypothetical protein